MKKLLLTALTVSALTFTNVSLANECKAIGDKAVSIMQWRQNRDDMFIVLEKFPDDKAMVLDAYTYERIDTMGALSDAISNSRNSRYQTRLDDANAKQKAIIDAFKVKYITECLGVN